jgi:hypothetical protein
MRISVLTTPQAGRHRPCAFHLGGRRVAVAAVISRWDDATGQCYEVRDLEGRRFVLRQCTESGLWELAGVYGRAATARRVAPVRLSV